MFLIKPPKRLMKARSSKDADEILARIESYLEGNAEAPVKILRGFWKDQQDAISYPELREMAKNGRVSNDTVKQWRQDYSVLAAKQMKGIWESAMDAGSLSQPLMDGLDFSFNLNAPGVVGWLANHGAEFVTQSTEQQNEAISAILARGYAEKHGIDEMAECIRPCIGLTKGQAQAVIRYYDSVKESLREQHPRMWNSTVESRARHKAQMYAERLHRDRAFTIAQTEMAFAYNRGADEGIRQAQKQQLIGIVKKVWSTSGDRNVCSACEALDGVEVGLDEGFMDELNSKVKDGEVKASVARSSFRAFDDMLPPAHPRCACAVQYIEIESPVALPGFNEDPILGQEKDFYSEEEVNEIALKTEALISKYISTPSKWTGGIVYEGEGKHNRKLWNCEILLSGDTAPHIIMHEQLHARSISYYDEAEYIRSRAIEEAVVEYAAKEICKVEGIPTINSVYDDNVEALRNICLRIDGEVDDLHWSVRMLEIPVPDRMDYLSEKLFDNLRIDGTIEEYEKYSHYLDMLYGD